MSLPYRAHLLPIKSILSSVLSEAPVAAQDQLTSYLDAPGDTIFSFRFCFTILLYFVNASSWNSAVRFLA